MPLILEVKIKIINEKFAWNQKKKFTPRTLSVLKAIQFLIRYG